MNEPGRELTAQEREDLDKHQQALADLLKKEPIDEDDDGVTLGRSAEAQAKIDEVEAQADRVKSFLEDQGNDARDRKILLLSEQLAETNDLVRRLLAKQGAAASIEAVVEEADEQMKERAHQNWMARVKKGGGFVTLIINAAEDIRKNHPVHVCHNGDVYKLPRGKQIKVPVEIEEILFHAVVAAQVQRVDDHGNIYTENVRQHTFPYAVVQSDDMNLDSFRGARLIDTPRAAAA